MKLFTATALILATVAGSQAFAMTATPLTSAIVYEINEIVPNADLSALSTAQVAELNGIFANTGDRSDAELRGAVKQVITAR